MSCFGNMFQRKQYKTYDDDELSFMPDNYFNSENVIWLGRETFEDFIKTRDVVLVMFYNPEQGISETAKAEFEEAANTFTRSGQAYATVDCKRDFPLCCSFRVPELPFYKVFGSGKMLFDVPNPSVFLQEGLDYYVKGGPLYKRDKYFKRYRIH